MSPSVPAQLRGRRHESRVRSAFRDISLRPEDEMEKHRAPSQPITENEAGAVAGGAARKAAPISDRPLSDGDTENIAGGRSDQGGDDDDLEELEVQR